MICTVLILALFMGYVGAAQVPDTSAAGAVLMDADSGRVLYSKNGDERHLIASITKLMTALVALESNHSPGEIVTVRPEWTGIEGSSLYLRPGEQLRLETLLYGMLLRSGNDAAHAVAGYCGGDVDSFVAAMNAKAKDLGMQNSRFANPSGLNAEGHYSTARDMGILAKACLENEMLKTIVSTQAVSLEGRIFTNHNKLLWLYEGCIGLKTGYTEKAGRTLVSAAEKDGTTLICVTLNAPNDWNDHAALFDYGFEHYDSRCLVQEGEILCRLPVKGSLVPFCAITAQETIHVALSSEDEILFQPVLYLDTPEAPVAAGDAIGEGIFTLNGEELVRVPLIISRWIQSDILPQRNSIFRRFGR